MPETNVRWLWLRYAWRSLTKWNVWSWGGLLALLGTVQQLWPWADKQLQGFPSWLWWVLAILCLFVAQYGVWKDDHEAAKDVKAELEKYTDKETLVTGPIEYLGAKDVQPTKKQTSEWGVQYVKEIDLTTNEPVKHFRVRCLSTAVPFTQVHARYPDPQPGVLMPITADVATRGDAVLLSFEPSVPAEETVSIRLAAREPIEGVRIDAGEVETREVE